MLILISVWNGPKPDYEVGLLRPSYLGAYLGRESTIHRFTGQPPNLIHEAPSSHGSREFPRDETYQATQIVDISLTEPECVFSLPCMALTPALLFVRAIASQH